MTHTLISALGPLFTLAQIGGFLLVVWGGYQLLTSLRGEGSSAHALRALRAELLTLTRPLLAALAAVTLLLVMVLLAPSTLTRWALIIAPLSTVVWLTRVKIQSKAVRPGALLEGLAPLSVTAQLSPEILARAHAVATGDLPTTGQALAQTALRALDDVRAEHPDERFTSPSPHQLATFLRDALRDLHAISLRLPLARALTFAEWEAEVSRLEEIWSQNLSRIDVGRALLNPLTLVDQVPHLHPKTLAARELSAWLHAGVYALVTSRLLGYVTPTAPAPAPAPAPTPSAEAPPATAPTHAPEGRFPLLGLFKTKLSAPVWLYVGLLSAAAVQGHGLIGAGGALLAGGATWWALRETFSLSRLRGALERLCALERPATIADDPREAQVKGLIEGLRKEAEGDLSKRPCGALLRVVTEGALRGSEVYRRHPEDAAPLRHLNFTLPDALATAHWVCDDLLKWQEQGGLLQKMLSLLESIGVANINVDQLLIKELREWAAGEARAGEAQGHTVFERAVAFDAWYAQKLGDLFVWVRVPAEMAINHLTTSTLTWLSGELERRLNDLYLARVPALEGLTASGADARG